MIFGKFQTKSKLGKIRTNEIILYFALLLICVVIYIWLKSYTNQASIELLIYLTNFHESEIEVFAFIGKMCSNIFTHILVSALIFNFSNIFKLFIFNSVFFLSLGTSAILKLIYLQPMVFTQNPDSNIQPLDCNFSWSAPFTSSVLITSAIMTLWWLFIPKINNHNMLRNVTFILAIAIILFINFCLFMFKLASISDIIFSMIIGFFVFALFFCILKLDPNNSKDLRKFYSNYKIVYIITNVLIFIGVLCLFFFNNKSEGELTTFNKAISQSNCSSEYPSNFDLSYDSLVLLAYFMTSYAMLFGILLEQYYLTKNDENRWGFFNFDNDANDMESIYTFNDEVKHSQWNDTSIKLSFVRVLLSLVVLVATIIPIYFIEYNIDIFIITLFVKYFLPFLIHTFCLFFVLKWMFIKLKLVNEAAFIKESQSTSASVILEEI